MKRLMMAVALVLAASTFARDRGDKAVEVKYDQFDDHTTVSVIGKISEYKLGLLYSCPGRRTDCHPQLIGVFLRAISGLGWQLIRVQRVIFLADGKRVELREVNWDGNSVTGVEVVSGVVTADDLLVLASADKLSLQAGPVERDLPEKTRRGWREFAEMAH